MKTNSFLDQSIPHESRIEASDTPNATNFRRFFLCSRRSIPKPLPSATLAWVTAMLLVGASSLIAQINSGSDGSDGVLDPASNLVIDMADHPDGIYQYESVNIRSGVTVTFIPNAANTPVVWLVQGNVTISGIIDVKGGGGSSGLPGLGGPGGFAGGVGPGPGKDPGEGLGPGGGKVSSGNYSFYGGSGSFGGLGHEESNRHPRGELYGNTYLLPLIGGSGGSGGWGYNGSTGVTSYSGGSGGGGAILIACSGTLNVTGSIDSRGVPPGQGGGYGSGGAIRLIGTTVSGNGSLRTRASGAGGGSGRVRIDALQDAFTGSVETPNSRGFQPIIIPPASSAITLRINSLGGVRVPNETTGDPIPPDVTLPASIQNPITVEVECANLPLNSQVFVEIKPVSGTSIRAVGVNDQGGLSQSFASVSVDLPRGAGTIQAKAVSGIVNQFASNSPNLDNLSLAQTGLLATGERFKAVEVTSTLGGGQSLVYISDSGQRYSLGN